MVPVSIHGGLPKGAGRTQIPSLNNYMAQLFPWGFVWGGFLELTAWLIAEFWYFWMDLGQQPSDLELTVFCQLFHDAVCLLTFLPVPTCRVQGCQLIPAEKLPFYSAEKGLQTDKATVFKLIDFSGITSASTCTGDRGRVCSEHRWCTSEQLRGDRSLLTLLCNLVPSTTSVTWSLSRVTYLPGLKKQWKWEHCHDPEVRLQLILESPSAASSGADSNISAQTVQICPGPWVCTWLRMSSASQLSCYLYSSQKTSGALRMERRATIHPLRCTTAKV